MIMYLLKVISNWSTKGGLAILVQAEADTKIMGMVAEQTKEWTELMRKQRKDNWEMIKGHRTAQEEVLKTIMEAAQVSHNSFTTSSYYVDSSRKFDPSIHTTRVFMTLQAFGLLYIQALMLSQKILALLMSDILHEIS